MNDLIIVENYVDPQCIRHLHLMSNFFIDLPRDSLGRGVLKQEMGVWHYRAEYPYRGVLDIACVGSDKKFRRLVVWSLAGCGSIREALSQAQNYFSSLFKDNLRKWKCDANPSHVLGILKSVRESAQVNGQIISYKTTQVILFREAVDVDKEIPDDIDVAGYIEGALLMHMTWKCTCCGTTKMWQPGEEALRWLYERHGKKEVRNG